MRVVNSFDNGAPGMDGYAFTECFEDGVCITRACPMFAISHVRCTCWAYLSSDESKECNSCDYYRTRTGNVCTNVDCTNFGIDIVNKTSAMADVQGGVCTADSGTAGGASTAGPEDDASSQDGGKTYTCKELDLEVKKRLREVEELINSASVVEGGKQFESSYGNNADGTGYEFLYTCGADEE
mmetsp:Transcript_29169/g.64307  ORF Transcript_29169/g.64307 Transcript_29169/m.64307 type:complete len:183 (+) Transcript_29169:57-605(+)|eukprot:CAMPEP_0178572380 /NCGR_PEP_ID=MMETSP0697-20121206/18189_1 /TAXON_ID=265572 /ORGANISM="Extubocellulus spinifer, Strain CCMP396" /LENGTH=182 /DNA_ID=CAMNT_0020207099 /DNA_START=163 /DNA_END=711 /DNA_ORIENTATION=+